MEQTMTRLPLIGDKAPHFEAQTTNGPINFPEDYKGKWVVLFSHPADFTPVCTTEFITFAQREHEFNALNAHLVGLSVDSLHSHIAWLRAIENLQYRNYKNTKVTFPLIVDLTMEVSNLYGMIHPNSGKTSAVRAVFIIDPEGIIRTILYYPSSTGRNFDELLRIIKALQTSDKEGVATPADWQPGEPMIVPPAGTTKLADNRMKGVKESVEMECQDWFFCFRKK
ncbi:MAG: peroxiredoxin [Acholeplasmataceae bacterium]|jgi:peroxiredoxin (alkyl hydroperoxide reductase subunit C)